MAGAPGFWDHYVHLYDDRPEGYAGSCLRPLGRCELGGCCDVCLHNEKREEVTCAKALRRS